MILLISALKVVLALLYPCHLLLVQEQVFSVLLLFVILISLPLQ